MAHPSAALSRPGTPTVTVEHDCVVAVYESRLAAEVASRQLVQSKFDMRNVSVIGRDYTTAEVVVGFFNAGDSMKACAKTGAFSGGLWGTLLGSALFVIPGIGPLFAAGPLVGRVIDAMKGAASEGMTALGAGLYSVGIPKDSILTLERKLKSGKFIVIAHGLPADVKSSRTILARTELPIGTVPEHRAQAASTESFIS